MTRIQSNMCTAGLIRYFPLLVAAAVLLIPGYANALINGVPGQNFSLTASADYISVADGASVYSWGYSTDGTMQLPGPTLIVTQGVMVTVTLTNSLPAAAGNVSIVFPGHTLTSTSGGVPGPLTQEAPPGGSVTYTFTASQPGTYQYHSGSQPDLQVEMGLYGALIVRPSSPTATCTPPTNPLTGGIAYDNSGACYDREYLYLLSEVDLDVHRAAELQAAGPGPIVLPPGEFHSEYWLLNGRTAPDTMAEAGTGLLPHQPYNAMTRMHPGERLLMRVVGAGREIHPFHHHGNHARVLARDGRLLVSASDSTKLAGPLLFTIQSVPGSTTDAVFEWTGKDLGWDIYGTVADGMPPHTCTDLVNNVTLAATSDGYADAGSDFPWEWCPDHDKEIPVTLPDLSSLAFGGFWGGSPYLGDLGSLPPGEGGLNPGAGFSYMWHSHTEREMVNNDVFPGGMMTMLIVEAPWISIP